MKVSTLKDSGKLGKFAKDKIVFQKGDLGNEMYIILKGSVNIYASQYSKETAPLAVLKSGDFFGGMALLEDFPRSTTAISQEEGLFLILDKVNFEKAIKNDPGFAIKIMQSLSNRLRIQTKRYVQLEAELKTCEAPAPFITESKTIQKGTFLAPQTENMKTFSIKVEDKPHLAFSEDFMSESFFPKGHQLYNVPEPDSYKEYVIDKEKDCPACGTSFNAFLVRRSKLNLTKTEEDFRLIYKDFDPIWYSIWTCPNCYYANFVEDFSKDLPTYQQEGILAKKDVLKKIFIYNPKDERNIDDVLNSYYQAIQSLLLKKEHSRDLGKIWMRLSWLYKDLGDSEMYEKASLQAFYYYYDDYYNGEVSSSKEDQQLSYLMGLFFMKFNNPVNARKNFFKAIVKKDGDQRINDQAYDKIQDMRKNE